MKNKIIIITIFLALGSSLFAQDVLNQYLETAAKNSPALKAKFNEYNASLEKIPQVGALPDPQLTFGYFVMPVETKNGPQQAKVTFTQMFPWFGTLDSKEDVFISAAKSKYEDFEDAKSNLFFNVKSTYYDLYYIQKGIDISLENIEILNTLKRLALIRIEAGTASGVDELRVELELNDLENNLALLKDKLFVNSVKFNNLLNVENNADIQIPKTLWIDDLQYSRQAIIDSLTMNNHQLKSLEFIKESFAHNEQQSRKQGSPNIILGLDYAAIGNSGTSPDAGKDALMVKVGITIPLYRKKYSAMVNEMVIQQQVLEDKKLNQINALETLFEKIYSEYSDANRRTVLFTKQSELAKRAIILLENEYANSGKNFEEILRMDKSVLKYSLELERAKTDKQASIAFINYLMGL
ncbi:MAG: TolC family protein [Bacteroidetes bacterium]|jgi:outer membrane protein, heavy metal efflux system|nr:TolC family protein [Bacteroidota bacterium]MBT6686860.1 TolC family protein [Bacteroidota bacterium]MBT7142589.1 TolC family protein [Bacteroidota bacterium]MBT7491854.1 TolC family protein [Bacteroidota bacterium]